MNKKTGTQFEKFVQELLMKEGYKVKHNIMYHKRKEPRRRCQIDLEYKTGILFSRKTIIECKYVSPGNSIDFLRAYIQLGEAMLFTGADTAMLATNARIKDKKRKEARYKIMIYDREDLSRLARTEDLEKRIRETAYEPAKDNRFIHRYI